MTNRLYCPDSGNISLAWALLFEKLSSTSGGECGPVSVVVDEFDANGLPIECRDIRRPLDAALLQLTGKDIEDVAATIFPFSLWNPKVADGGQHVFERYGRIWPRLKKRARQNAKGNYFQRLVNFEDSDQFNAGTNQLAKIISNYKKTHRRSALQATIFDPHRDLAPTPMAGFPCLQQVAFSPTSKGLVVTGYYVLQYIFERGYGNYLGLCRLAAFMAAQFDIPLVKVVTMISFATRSDDKLDKFSLKALQLNLHSVLSSEKGIR